jgi:hypothetical protein
LRPPADPLIIPSGGVSTTAQDMARYLQFHINKGAIDGTRLLSEDLAETMYTPPSQAALDGGYALGIGVGTRNGARHFQHGGGGFGFNSSMVWYPELKLGSVVLTNSEQPDAYYYHLSEDVLDSIIASAPTLYAQRAGSAVQAAPAYPPSRDATVLSNKGLAALIRSKALPVDAAAQSRRQTYVGSYLLTMWGIPAITAEISARDDDLYFSALGASGPLTEVEPGLFFTPGGDTFDARGLFPTALNIRLVKENPGALPITIAFYALCGLIFLSTLLFWPVRAGIRRIRRMGVHAAPAARNPWLTWTAILAGLASLFSLFCLALIALVPGLVSVPWPRPYEDLLPWQFGALSLPFVCLLLGVLIALLAGPLTRSRAWDALTRYYYLIVALALLAFNLAIIT